MAKPTPERGRPLGFDQAAALDAASRTFWQHGYESTSTPILETSMGVSRSSLANTFGTKHDLFLACLDNYLDATETQLINPLHDATTDGIAACIAFFQRLARLKQDEPGSHGCLMVNTMTELGTTDPDVAPRARRYHTALRTGFESALTRAGEAHSIPSHAAETLVALAMTINLHARTGSTTGVRSTSRAARSLLASWQGNSRHA